MDKPSISEIILVESSSYITSHVFTPNESSSYNFIIWITQSNKNTADLFKFLGPIRYDLDRSPNLQFDLVFLRLEVEHLISLQRKHHI